MPWFAARGSFCSAGSLPHCWALGSLHRSPSDPLLPRQNARATLPDSEWSTAPDPSCLLLDHSFDATSHRHPFLLAFSTGLHPRYVLAQLPREANLAFGALLRVL